MYYAEKGSTSYAAELQRIGSFNFQKAVNIQVTKLHLTYSTNANFNYATDPLYKATI